MTQKTAASKTTDTKNNSQVSKACRNQSPSPMSPQAQLIQLHRQYGNRAVQRMYESGTLQAMLKIGGTGPQIRPKPT